MTFEKQKSYEIHLTALHLNKQIGEIYDFMLSNSLPKGAHDEAIEQLQSAVDNLFTAARRLEGVK